jgi:hypothetical protein
MEVQIGGTTFIVDPKDNFLVTGLKDENGTDICGLGTTTEQLVDVPSDMFIL